MWLKMIGPLVAIVGYEADANEVGRPVTKFNGQEGVHPWFCENGQGFIWVYSTSAKRQKYLPYLCSL